MARSNNYEPGAGWTTRWRRAGILALLVTHCAGGVRWVARAVYRPASGAWDQVEIRFHGTRAPGHDVAGACEGTIALRSGGGTRTLEVRSTASRAIVTGTEPPGLVSAGTPLEAAALRAASGALSAAEAADILHVLDAACLGPKAGFPLVPTLVTVVAESRYE